MQYLAVFACLVVAVSASMWGHNGGNMAGNNMPNLFQNIMNGMGQYNNGVHQQQNNMNLLQQLLQSHMGQNQMSNQNWNYGGQQYQQRPQQQPQQQHGGLTNSVLGSLLGNMLAGLFRNQMGGGNQQREGEEEKDEYGRMEEFMKLSMAKEMFDVMRAYNQYKDNEEEFGKAMYHLCYMVNATYAASKKYNFKLFNVTTDETGEELERQSMGATEEEKMQGAIDLLVNQEQLWREMFFRMATWSCFAGKEYLDSAMKLDKMTKGDKCDKDD